MALPNEDTIRTLASFKAPDRPVVTLYLDIDGKRWPKFSECEARAERLVNDAIDAANANGHASAIRDLRKVESFIHGGIDRSGARGLAVFACGDALWEVIPLPVRVKDQVVVNETPHVRQLESVVDNYPGFGVLLVDKQRARMFVIKLSELVDKSELFDALPRHDDDAGSKDRGHDKSNPLDAATRQHLKRAATVAFEAWKQHPFRHLILGAGPEVITELEGDLHSYLKEKIAARLHVATNTSDAVILAAAAEVQEQVERDQEAAMVSRLREAAGAGRNGVTGLDGVLAALSERRVDTLVVSDGFEAPGWRCKTCRALASKGRACPLCENEMVLVDDVVEEAVEEALLQSCHVEMCVGNADLDVAGRIGALLRF